MRVFRVKDICLRTQRKLGFKTGPILVLIYRFLSWHHLVDLASRLSYGVAWGIRPPASFNKKACSQPSVAAPSTGPGGGRGARDANEPQQTGATRSPSPLGTLMLPAPRSVGPPHARRPARAFGALSDLKAPGSVAVASGEGSAAGRVCNHGAPTQSGAQRRIRAYWHSTLPLSLGP